MLHEIHVQNYAVIDSLQVEFAPGLNLLSGETGSGKSILVDALGLALGGRASAEVIRSGQERGEFREFPTRVMATTLRSTIDGLAQVLTADPNLDLKAYAKELVTVFDLATRK